MKLVLALFSFFTLSTFAQDTLKIKKVRNYYDDCYLVLRADSNYYISTIPKAIFDSEAKIELRMFKDCEAGKRNDIFVSSFQIKGIGTEQAASSFFTDAQKKAIVKLSGNTFTITNIQIHAPDGFMKQQDLQFFLK
jgi:hypothetical protein